MTDEPKKQGGYASATDFENPFHNFVEALRILSYDAKTQCAEMGNHNAARQIRNEVTGLGALVLASPHSYLTAVQKKAIAGLTDSIKRLPEQAINPGYADMTTHAGCMKSMQHPAWDPMRVRARQLLVLLEWAIRCNEASLGDAERN